MGLTYILVALVAVILNNVLVEMLSLHTRITVGESVYLENKGMGEEAADWPETAAGLRGKLHHSSEPEE